MKKQKNYALRHIYNALKQGLNESKNSIPKSDIFNSLYHIVESSISKSNYNNTIILLVSDMLENSTISSFYLNGRVKKINPKKEFLRFKKSGLICNFKGAKVYVLGAGITSTKYYRDPKTMKSIRDFWIKYFQTTNANLIEFGEPMLFKTIK